MTTNLTTLTDEQITQLRDQTINELERRQRLNTTPTTIATVTAQYIQDGGTKQDIITAVESVDA